MISFAFDVFYLTFCNASFSYGCFPKYFIQCNYFFQFYSKVCRPIICRSFECSFLSTKTVIQQDVGSFSFHSGYFKTMFACVPTNWRSDIVAQRNSAVQEKVQAFQDHFLVTFDCCIIWLQIHAYVFLVGSSCTGRSEQVRLSRIGPIGMS